MSGHLLPLGRFLAGCRALGCRFRGRGSCLCPGGCRLGGLRRRSAALGGPARLRRTFRSRAPFASAHAAGLLVLRLAAAGSTFLAAARGLVDSRPRAPLGLILGNAAILVSFLDVLGLALLLSGMALLASTRHHRLLLSACTGIARAKTVPNPRHRHPHCGESARVCGAAVAMAMHRRKNMPVSLTAVLQFLPTQRAGIFAKATAARGCIAA